MSREVKVGNEWVRVAGRGKAEYGASHYQTGTATIAVSSLNEVYSTHVTFDKEMPDVDYIIELQSGAGNAFCRPAAVTVSGFDIDTYKLSGGTGNVSVKWQAFKLYSDKEYDGLLDDVAEMKTLKDITSSSTISASVNPNCIKVVRCGNVVDVSMSYASSNVLVDLPAGAAGQIVGGLPNSASLTSGDFIGGDTQGKYYMLYFQNGAVRPRQAISAGSVLTFHFTYITSD